MTYKIDASTAEHYTWGNGCDGWHLLNNENLSIIQENVPAGSSEVKHYHNISRQFFFILEGEGTIELPDKIVKLLKNEGLEIPPKTVHRFINQSDSEVIFLVISSPKSHGDKVNYKE
jgi:mannose-6-phosphate isomerase-like protein (cupin superfamily)